MDTGLYAISLSPAGRISLTGVYPTGAEARDHLLREDLVRPLDERHERRRVGERGVLPGKVVDQDPTGPRAGASDVDRHAMRDHLRERLRERRPADRHDRGRDDRTHQGHGLPEQEDLDLVAG